jgi:hypothetical protein
MSAQEENHHMAPVTLTPSLAQSLGHFPQACRVCRQPATALMVDLFLCGPCLDARFAKARPLAPVDLRPDDDAPYLRQLRANEREGWDFQAEIDRNARRHGVR